MLLTLLLACYDKATLVAHLDRTADTVVATSRVVNAWENSIACTDVESCVAAIQTERRNQEAALREQGATEAIGAVAVHDGELDIVMRWTMPLASAVYEHQSFLLLHDQPAKGAILGEKQRAHLAFVWHEDASTLVTVDRAPAGSRVWTMPDEPARHALVFPGKKADVALTFTNLDREGKPAHAPGWIGKYPGLEEALRATPGLVVD